MFVAQSHSYFWIKFKLTFLPYYLCTCSPYLLYIYHTFKWKVWKFKIIPNIHHSYKGSFKRHWGHSIFIFIQFIKQCPWYLCPQGALISSKGTYPSASLYVYGASSCNAFKQIAHYNYFKTYVRFPHFLRHWFDHNCNRKKEAKEMQAELFWGHRFFGCRAKRTGIKLKQCTRSLINNWVWTQSDWMGNILSRAEYQYTYDDQEANQEKLGIVGVGEVRSFPIDCICVNLRKEH